MFNEGDIITLAYDGENYLVAKIILIEKLTLHDLTHLMIYDTFVQAGPEGYDNQGDYCKRTHELVDISNLGVAIDHIALTASALEESDPMIIGHEDVTKEELKGYAVWVALRRDKAERSGMIRYETEEDLEEEYLDEEEYEEELAEEVEELAEEVDEALDEVLESRAIEDEEEYEVEIEGENADLVPEDHVEVKAHTWHDTIFDIPLSQALLELADIFKGEEFNESVLAASVLDHVHGDNEEINALVRRLVDEGDYGAGQELLVFGDEGADALNRELLSAKEPQTVEDILQIMGDMGSERAYGHIADFFESRMGGLPDDPISVAAARAFCYVVMLTGGTPDVLQDRLKLIEQLDYPELREDAESAIAAIRSQGTEVPETDTTSQSNDPFGAL